jgi:hypothetical protein
MPLGAARLNFLSKTQVVVAAVVIRKKVGILAIGDAQIDTAQSKFGGASAYFDGTGDLLQASTDASLTIPSGEDFTIEGWIRPGSVSGTIGLLTDRASSNSLAGVNWDISIFSGTYLGTRTVTLVFETGSGAGSIVIISNNNVFTTNTWYHFAVVRSSNVISLYVNGVDVTNNRVGTQSSGIGAGNLTIGGFPNGALMYSGHFDEIRWSNTARYTSGFTPSTTPFVNDDNTKLLLHYDGSDGSTYFDDDNGVGRSAVGCTFVSTAAISTSDSKFGGSSLFLDGNWSTTNAMVNVGQGSSTNGTFNTGTGDFTVECWFNTDTVGSQGLIMDLRQSNNTNVGVVLYHDNADIKFFAQGADRITGSGLISAGTWYHIALSRSSGTSKFFLDGTQVGSDYADTNNYGLHGIGLGTVHSSGGGSANFEGHIDEVRFSNTARYTTSFTPQTAPFVNDANTLFLGHFDGTNNSTLGLDDNGTGRSAVGVSAVATAQVDTAQSYFGGSSALFNPSSLDHLLIDDIGGSNNLDTNWTFECWYRPTNRTGTVYPVILANHTTSWASGDWGFFDRHNAASTKFTFFINAYSSVSPALESTTVVSNGTWYHLAVVKQGNDYELFVDGTSEDTLTTAAAIATNRDLRIGSSGNATSKTVNGHIDEVRISNTARYTTGFTPSTTPFQNDANTKLLLHMDGTDGSTDFVDDNGKEAA